MGHFPWEGADFRFQKTDISEKFSFHEISPFSLGFELRFELHDERSSRKNYGSDLVRRISGPNSVLKLEGMGEKVPQIVKVHKTARFFRNFDWETCCLLSN